MALLFADFEFVLSSFDLSFWRVILRASSLPTSALVSGHPRKVYHKVFQWLSPHCLASYSRRSRSRALEEPCGAQFYRIDPTFQEAPLNRWSHYLFHRRRVM